MNPCSFFTLVSTACMICFVCPSSAEPLKHTTLPNDNPDMTLSRFAFGACWKSGLSQNHWEPIVANQPQLWLWLGDNIYADTDDMAVMKKKYSLLGDTPGYRKLAAACPVLATWDDHDYGKNDAGKEYAKRAESQREFLEFFNERADSQRHQQEGIYTSYYFGKGDKRVQLILLDTRYFRTSLKKITGNPPYRPMGKYTPDFSDEANVLGDTQWKWLEEELKQPARVRIIGTSIQFAAPHNGFEGWANFPTETQRMIDLIIQTRAQGVVFLSGDIHSSEFNQLEPQGCYPLFEHTSSSLNLPLGSAITRRRLGSAYGGPNFGLVEIDWSVADPTIRFSTKDRENQTRIHHSIPLSKLTFDEQNLIWKTTPDHFAGTWQTFHGPLTLVKGKDGKWTGKCANRTLELTSGQFGLAGSWQDEKQNGKVTFSLSRDGKFLKGAYSYEDLPLQLDWAGWKADWEKHFKRDDWHLRKKKKKNKNS